MKTMQSVTLTAMALSTLATGSAFAATDLDAMSNVNLAAIKKVQVVDTNDTYYVDLELKFTNKNPDPFKLRRAELSLKLESVEKPKETKGKVKEEAEEPQPISIPIGNAQVSCLEIPGASANTAGTTNQTIRVCVGRKCDATSSTVMRLMNVLADPDAPRTLALEGSAEVGIKLPRGWLFEAGKRYEVDLRFVPTIQPEFAMQ